MKYIFKKTDTVCFHLYEVPRAVKFIRQTVEHGYYRLVGAGEKKSYYSYMPIYRERERETYTIYIKYINKKQKQK